MIAGGIVIDRAARTVHTRRDSYRLDGVSVVSVRRPLLPAGIATSAVAGGFGLQFVDLLYPGELLTVAGLAGLALASGLQIGRLSLLSRDLRGTDLAGVVWGRAASLQSIRRDIVDALAMQRSAS